MAKIKEFWAPPASMAARQHKTEDVRWILYVEYEALADKHLNTSLKHLELAERYGEMVERYIELSKKLETE